MIVEEFFHLRRIAPLLRYVTDDSLATQIQRSGGSPTVSSPARDPQSNTKQEGTPQYHK